jgi:hypothetical protein
MKRLTLLTIAAAMTIGVSVPAMADYVRLGSVDVGYRTDADTAYTRFGGRMESLRLTADRSDVFCRSIRVRYANGDVDDVFHGALREDRPVNVDLRGRSARVDSIRFVCRSDEFRGGKIYIAADVGRYRDEWRRDRDWDRMWSGLFGMGPGPDMHGGPDHDMHGGPDRDMHGGPDRDEWMSLGTQSFEGRNDTESTFTGGWTGRNVERIGLRPLDADARCMRVVVTFRNGHKVKLEDLLPGVLQRDRVAVLDLPGHDRDIRNLFLRCRALGEYRVRIEILVRK